MFKKIFFLLLFAGSVTYSQHTIKGNIKNGDNFSWVLLYNFVNGEPEYLNRAPVENGHFEFVLDKNAKPGMYRVFYKIVDNLYVDFIYNHEDVDFSFDPKDPLKSIVFYKSDENKIYRDYLKNISQKQHQLDSLQVVIFKSKNTEIDDKIEKQYKSVYSELNQVQQKFEDLSAGKVAHGFIKSSAQNNAKTPFKSPEAYLAFTKEHYFDSIDFKNEVLNNSTFINDKLLDYVFYLNQANNQQAKSILQKEAIKNAVPKLNNDNRLLSSFENSLLKQYLYEGNTEMIEFVISDYYTKLPKMFQDNRLLFEVQSALKTAVGKDAPDFTWQENGKSKNLHGLVGHDYYIVMFFSSGCPHCQVDMPKFHNFIKDYENVKVVAIGLEDEKESYDKMIKNYVEFINILDLDKWDSKKAKDYGVTGIPSYFILDSNKKIIGKPDDVDELKSMFRPE